MADRAQEHEPPLRPGALRADAVEGELVARFSAHPVLAGVERLSPAVFVEILLQRRFLSLMFPVVYDMGIDGLTDEPAIRLVREILREEYPDPRGRTPSHREDLVEDLVVLGVARERILGARPTPATRAVIEQTLALIAEAAPRDLEVMTILRFWGEVLVSVEYGEYWRRMEAAFAAAGTPSRFYHPHHHHDGRDPLGHVGGGGENPRRPARGLPPAAPRRARRSGALRGNRAPDPRPAPRVLRPVLR